MTLLDNQPNDRIKGLLENPKQSEYNSDTKQLVLFYEKNSDLTALFDNLLSSKSIRTFISNYFVVRTTATVIGNLLKINAGECGYSFVLSKATLVGLKLLSEQMEFRFEMLEMPSGYRIKLWTR
jgi:hypothetical protein